MTDFPMDGLPPDIRLDRDGRRVRPMKVVQFGNDGDSHMEHSTDSVNLICIGCAAPFVATVNYVHIAGRKFPVPPPPTTCPDCDMAAQAALAAEERERQRVEAAKRAVLLSERLEVMLPWDVRDARMSMLPPKLAERLGEWVDDPFERWLYLTGPVGRGKSFTMGALVNAVWGRPGIETGAWANVPILMEELRRSFARKEKGKGAVQVADLIEQLCVADLTVLDDIGRENPTPFVVDRLYVVIQYRMQNNLPTAFTSNCGVTTLGERLGDQISSRIAGKCDGNQIGIGGEDRRKKKQQVTT